MAAAKNHGQTQTNGKSRALNHMITETIEDLSELCPDDLYNLANNLQRVHKRDLIKALYEKAYDHGVVEAALNYGAFLESRSEFEAAINWYEKAYASGDIRAAVLIAQIHVSFKNMPFALEWYRKAKSMPESAVGHSRVARSLGLNAEAISVLEDNKQISPEAAAELVTHWNELSLDAVLELLHMHWKRREEDGEAYVVGVPLANLLCDLGQTEQALAIYREAAERGDAFAAFNLGVELLAEEGEEAIKWITLAKELGDKRAKKWLRTRRKENGQEDAISTFP